MIYSRFIINIPKHERTGFNRISFQIELAHWFYLDYYCAQDSQLRPYKLKDFFYYIFQVFNELLRDYLFC